jgi:hypothetical protein
MHHHMAFRLLEETLTETTTTMVAVRAIAQSFSRNRVRKDGLSDPSLVMLLAVVISTMLSTLCCIEPLTDTLGPSSTTL